MDRRETLAGVAVVRLTAVAGPRTKLQGRPGKTRAGMSPGFSRA